MCKMVAAAAAAAEESSAAAAAIQMANQVAHAQSPGIAEIFAMAHANAPRCGKVQLEWMTIAQAAAAVRISKNVLSSWATRGYIASVKGGGSNDHRLVHLDNILHFLADSITGHNNMASAPSNAIITA